jgi:hypothetical protein
VKIRRLKIQDQTRKTVHEIPSQPLVQHSTPHLLSQAILESEIRRPAEQKRWQDPILTEESWVWWYMPVKAAIAGWRILIQATLGKRQDPVSKITRVKRV